jgi:hypothetical protein
LNFYGTNHTIKKFIFKLLIKLCQKENNEEEIIFSGFYFFIKIKEEKKWQKLFIKDKQVFSYRSNSND